jgi:WD40 repeat protein/tRNA A-37 threonylcarbamoyl transferase component Bud32
MFRAGDRIGPYVLVRRIGGGQFGVVWLAERRTLITSTEVALKLPRDEDVELEAIRQEAAVWVKASGHPNVLPIIEADLYDGQAVIVSEYAPGGSLDDWVKQHGGKAPSIDAAIEMVSGILAGLEHLHARRIIHRDLKPGNILLQGETPRLADFGISGVLKSSTRSTLSRGTPAYMSPEAFDGKFSEQTDIWSTAVILYQLLSGHLPFPQKDLASLMGAITRHHPYPLPDSIPMALQDVVGSALQRSLEHRYKSAAEMRKALRQAQIAQSERTTAELPAHPAHAICLEEHLRSQSQIAPTGHSWNHLSWVHGAILAVLLIMGASALYVSGILPRIPVQRSLSGSKMSVELKQTLTGHTDAVYSVVFSPDGKTLASGSDDSTVKLWDIPTSELKRTLQGHNAGVYSVAFSPDGGTLASGGDDNTVKVWDVQTQELRRTLIGHIGSIYLVSFSDDGKLFSGSNDETVKVWDPITGELKRTLKGLDHDVNVASVSPDGKTSASGSVDNTVKIRDILTGDLRLALKGHSWPVTAVAFSPDGKTLASGSLDKTVRLWDVSGLK